MLSFLMIQVASYIALYRIRSFFKSKGLSHRTNTCKIAFQASIFSIFTISLVVISLNIFVFHEKNTKPTDYQEKVYYYEHYAFAAIVNLADLGFIWVLYQLGTMQVKERYKTEASAMSSTRLTAKEEIDEDESDHLNLTLSQRTATLVSSRLSSV